MKITAKQSFRLVVATVFLMAVSARVRGQAPAPKRTPALDYSNVEIMTTMITKNFYTMEAPGPPMSANIGMLVTPDGILLVDSDIAPMTPKFVAAIQQVSNAPIRYLVNTVMHPAHTGGNENFAKMGVIIFGREELRNRLEHTAPAANGTPVTPVPAGILPAVTYTSPITIHIGGQDVELLPVRARTDGDTMIRFVGEDVIMTGDSFRSQGYAYFDVENGGTFQGVIDALNLAIKLAGPNTKIVPSHGAAVDRAALIANRDMMQVIRDRVARMIQQGKTQDEVLAARLTSDYDAKIVDPGTTGNRLVAAIYAELKAAR